MFYTVERIPDIVVTDTLRLHVPATAEVDTVREQLLHFALGEMIHQFLRHTVDIKNSNLIDKLVTKDVTSPDERRRIKEEKKTDAKVDILMMMMREKSAAEFERFLATLSEIGQHSVADVVHEALHAVGQTGQNPLRRHLFSKSEYIGVQMLLFS